ncbi:MAG: oligosaccharide flippase family protein [Catenibacterium mitsuokai]|nr:oligosaccharide flippase family protein [Catenibacterium mitsuokai]MEE0335027.1 oligosaccharide flippase family protein [Catenibacterium mitsuokai]
MKKNELKQGVILSYINLGIGTIIPFIYTPIMLSILGQAEYGLFSLASSAVSYLSLLSFGFGSTIIRYISKYRAENDKESEEKVFGFFLVLYCALALLVLICGAVIAYNVEPLFSKGLTASELNKMKILIMIMTFNSALSFPLSVYSSMVVAHEKYIFRKLLDMVSTVLAPIANLVALYLGYASVGMATAATIIQFIILPLNVFYCYRIINIKPIFTKLPKTLIKEMLGFSVFIFIGTLVDMLFWATDKVILGMLVGSVAVAIYNVGSTFNTMVMNLSTSISGVFTPRVTGMVVKEASKEELNSIFIRIGRIQFIIIALIVSGFTVFGQSFIKLWAGPGYSGAYWIAIMTMFPLCIPLIQNMGLTIVIAQNKHQFRSIVYLIIAVANVIMTYISVPYFGIYGAAACSCIAYIIGQGIIMNIYYYKVTGLDIPLFWRNIFKMAIVPIIMTGACLFLNNFITINSWKIFLCGVVVFTLIYAILMYLFSFNQYERVLFGGILKKVKHS